LAWSNGSGASAALGHATRVAQRAWASYEFLFFHGNVTESPPSRIFVRAGAPNPFVPPFSSHTFTFFFNKFSILFPSRLCTQPDNREFTKTKKIRIGKQMMMTFVF
jgi:hypothetical protein